MTNPENESKTVNIDIRKDLFGANENAAALNAEIFKKHGIVAVDIMGSVGTGKTQLIESLCEHLRDKYRILMFAGDLATTIDADRVASHGVDTVQINTGTACHLDAIWAISLLVPGNDQSSTSEGRPSRLSSSLHRKCWKPDLPCWIFTRR